MADVDTKTVGKAFRGALVKIRMPERQINTVLSKLAVINRAGISMDDLKIVVQNITSKEDFRNDFLKSDVRVIVKNIRSNATHR